MPKIAAIIGLTTTSLSAIALGGMSFLSGCKDWELAIFLLLIFLGSIGVSVIGFFLALACWSSHPEQSGIVKVALILNLIPGLLFALIKFAL